MSNWIHLFKAIKKKKNMSKNIFHIKLSQIVNNYNVLNTFSEQQRKIYMNVYLFIHISCVYIYMRKSIRQNGESVFNRSLVSNVTTRDLLYISSFYYLLKCLTSYFSCEFWLCVCCYNAKKGYLFKKKTVYTVWLFKCFKNSQI